MSAVERVLRAGAAVAAGFVVAWEHLTGATADEPPTARVGHACPICARSLADGPHVHDEDVVWPTEHPDTVLVTDLTGGDPLVIHGGAA